MEIDGIMIGAGCFVALLGAVWWHSMKMITSEIQTSRKQSDARLPEIVASFAKLLPDVGEISPDYDGLKEDFAEIIEDVLGDAMQNMQMPTAQDHIFGAIANIVQHKFMAQAPPGLAEMLPSINEDVSDSDLHGSP